MIATDNSPKIDSLSRSELVSGWLFAVAYAFSILPSGLSWDTTTNAELLEGSWIVRLQWTSLFLWAWYMMKEIPLPVLVRHLKMNWVLILLLTYCTASLFWSDFPGIVIKRFVQFVGVLSILILVAHHHERRIERLILVVLVAGFVVCGLSIFFSVAVPSIGIETAVGIEGTWKGIVGQKNLLGMFSAATCYATVYCVMRRAVPPVFAGGVFFTAGVCLVMSRSSSSATLLVLATALFLLLRKDFIRSYAPIIRFLLVLGTLICVVWLGFFFVNGYFPATTDLLTPFAAIFGKSADLTGRGDIWELMWRSIEKRPLLGVGFSSFWLGPGGPSQFIVDELQWGVPSAHNGYLEVINELGWVGFFFFILMILHHCKYLVEFFVHEREQAAFHIGFLSIYLVSNFSESTALRMLFFLQFMLYFSMLMVSTAVLRIRTKNGVLS
jgi:exopolysaccharide production protein ExoQ